MTEKKQRKPPRPAVNTPDHLDEVKLHGRMYRVGETILIDGLAGEFKIRRFDLRHTGIEVEVFGGVPGRTAIRQFRVERIVPPDGSPAAVKHRSQTLSADPIRDAIAADGEVRVTLTDPDPKVRKRTVNRVFSRAYSLGLKGRFRVRVEDDVVIGWRTDDDPPEEMIPDGR